MRGKRVGWVAAAIVVVGIVAQNSARNSAQDNGADEHDAARPRAAGASATSGAGPTPPDDPTSSSTAATQTPGTPATTHSPAAAPTADAHPTPTRGTALAALAGLEVKGRAPMTGYDRDRFGSAWLDADRNGCDTRNDVLRRDLTDRVVEAGTNGCVVLSGSLADPYTGDRVPFRRGGGADVDIDHVVALGNAWVTGAFRWDIRKRAALANDPLELLAVDAGANRQKGDGDAATWLPPHKAYRCAYVARQVAVKQKYGLWVTAPEKAALQRVLASCPRQPLTADRWHAPLRVDHDIHDPGAPAAPAPASASSKPRTLTGGATYYDNCDAAREAGVAPLHRGDPGYDDHLDRDGDGVACE